MAKRLYLRGFGLQFEYIFENCCATSVSICYLNRQIPPVRQIWAGQNLITSSIFEILKIGLTDLFLSSIRVFFLRGIRKMTNVTEVIIIVQTLWCLDEQHHS